MNNILLLLLTSWATLSYSQSPTLVQDYFPGPEGPCQHRLYDFQGVLTFQGVDQSGETVIYQYDPTEDNISVVITSADMGTQIIGMGSNGEEVIIYTSSDGVRLTGLWKAFNPDFSDLRLVYDSGANEISRFRFYNEYNIIFETEGDSPSVVNVVIADNNGNTADAISSLPHTVADYNYNVTGDYLILAPEIEAIDGQNVLAYNLVTNQLMPITDVLTNYEDCGLLRSLYIGNGTIMAIRCADENLIYDIPTQRYLPYDGSQVFITFDLPDYTYFSSGSNIYKYDKTNLTQELLQDNVLTSRGDGTNLIYAVDAGSKVDFVKYDYASEETTVYPSDFSSSNFSSRFSGFAQHETGVHFHMYFNQNDENDYLIRLGETISVLDTMQDIFSSYRPTAYDGDIYYTHPDPVYGKELFRVDYGFTSTVSDVSGDLLQIYPNPSHDMIHIDCDKWEDIEAISILDQLGRVVLTTAYSGSIDISPLSPGTYSVAAKLSSGSTVTRKLVVQ